ncbi:Ferredoxin-dependent glutamate synthase 1 [Lacunisphaera limnophila]|uniref:Glutamate synthase [NADPH] large chain n=1 Tax=Lacunisphaera limnophila TaxID=1838286 RepID=A0A1D8AZU2_9BACT|nr:glutamate synthase large subunit [Lacunisphaera limnophila]AOS46374.1 Ferredoxin-dependent glutamate synthase 1 [Lacunisphaera limnophila]
MSNLTNDSAARPGKQGLYDPWFEHDACGVGFVVDMKGRKSHQTLQQGLQVLKNLDHRGASGAEINTGDGAGILLQIPHKFFTEVTKKLSRLNLPAEGQYGAGLVYLPRNPTARRKLEEVFAGIIQSEGQVLLGWRTVPTDNSMLGDTAKSAEPFMRQVFIGRGADTPDDAAFERKLYVIRKRAYAVIRTSTYSGAEMWYIPSLSFKTFVYKGMLTTEQLERYFPDLQHPAMETAIALVHSRFSTNTFPSWDRAHPYRYIAHNGEINTLRGNINWMHARQALFASELFGEDISKILPIINPNGSDSSMFDNTLELLVLAGRPLSHAMMMMIPEPWSNHETMDDARKAFYQYHSCLMEPWDGPAAICFTDGRQMGAVLDRNGLRPCRYYITNDDLCVMASEAGVLDLPPESIREKGRLQPGHMFLVDTVEGRIIPDAEIKRQLAGERPYREWLNEHLVKLEALPAAPSVPQPDHATLLHRQLAFGYTFEDQRIILAPMARDGVEAIGSMGNDTPLAVLSNKPRLLYDYFKQLFAQVTNPPIDSIREEIITSAETRLGSEGNLLNPDPLACRRVELKWPVLTNEEFAKIRRLDQPGFKVGVLPILFRASRGDKGLAKAMEEICHIARRMIEDEEVTILILSDRGVTKDFAPIPALLAAAGLHHFLIREGLRTRISMVLETGEAREVHHFALLIGYGCSAINPYVAFETIDGMIQDGMLPGLDHKKACQNMVKAASKGIIKVASKMGISAIQSYRGAQVFEAVGLRQDVIDHYFTWTPSRVGGIGLDVIAQEVLTRHRAAYPDREVNGTVLPVGGQYQYRNDGEFHLFNPESIHRLQKAVRTGSYAAFKDYSKIVNETSKNVATLRGMLDFKFADAIPLEEVESVEKIMKRFKTGAMSYGSISKEAHETLAIAMNRIGGMSNTGEGGEDADRFVPMANGDSKNSAIKQVAAGRFGVTSEYLASAKELQIKMAQGAKPGEGGQLPGTKVYPWVAKTRGTTPGVGLISPPPHHDIYSIEDLAELIHDLKNSNRHARVSVKLVAEVGVGTIAAGVAKAHADVVLISGFDGGTGSSPLTSVQHAGLPWELGLAETHQTLVLNNLRSRIAVETDGQLKTGRDVIVAALLGAEEFGFATAPLVATGCIMMRVCHLNTCPAGVATQDPRLREKFAGKPEHVVNFMRFIAEEVRELMAQLGYRTIEEMIGHTERLEPRQAVAHWKARGLDFSNILYQPEVGPEVGRFCTIKQDHGLDKSLDLTTLLTLAQPAITKGEKVVAELPIKNVNRVVGTITSYEVTKKYGAKGLPADTISFRFKGSAGQSFGAFVTHGFTLSIEGDANDYVGKGLSGGKIIIHPPANASFKASENIIVGNVALYGATAGEVYLNGRAGERFAVRNSGVSAVVEGVGDHACEYMTGGRVVVLGSTGRNFAAGMSGGVAYVLDEAGVFAPDVNLAMVGLEKLETSIEIAEVRALIQKHFDYTKSPRAQEVLANWAALVPKFVKVMPKDYKRMLACIERVQAQGLTGDEALLAAFEENAKDTSRVGGN